MRDFKMIYLLILICLIVGCKKEAPLKQPAEIPIHQVNDKSPFVGYI